MIGEIIISTDAAIKQAKIYNTTLAREIVLYITHGILHLTGYDDHRHWDTVRMREREKKVLGILGKESDNVIVKKK